MKSCDFPTDGVGNAAAPRVANTVSPPRVANTTAQQMSPQPNTSSLSTPNSHRRQKTPARCVITPQTPHVMVRRSVGQQHNLSQDMIAETISQANHCFSISTGPEPKNSTILSGNNQIIILPEMANAVICPETGKSLKHQELITKLRYKIKWMRSTANEINRLYNTNTIRFIRRSNISKGQKVTYGSFVVDIKDHKEEKEHTRLTVGGDQIEFPAAQHILPRNHLLLARMILGEYRASIGPVCAVSVGNHPWLDCAVTIRWRGCLPVAIHTCLSEFICIHLRLVIVRSNRTYR
jgi:hypothetical protein